MAVLYVDPVYIMDGGVNVKCRAAVDAFILKQNLKCLNTSQHPKVV